MYKNKLTNICCVVLMACVAVPVTAADLTDLMPAETMVYIGWPGAEKLSETYTDTEMMKMLNESEVARFTDAMTNALMPAVMELIAEHGGHNEAEMFQAAMQGVRAVWSQPTAAALIDFGMSPIGPAVDMVYLIEAGDQSAEIIAQLDSALGEIADNCGDDAVMSDVTVGSAKLKQLTFNDGPAMPLRWGVMDNHVVMTLGMKYYEFLDAGDAAKTLTTNERFAAAAKITKATNHVPTLFVDVQAILTNLEQFQPMLSMMQIPGLSEENAIRTLLDNFGLSAVQSLSMVMLPEAGGFKTQMFLHGPEMKKGLPAILKQKPLTEDDLKLVPQNVTYAAVVNADLKGAMNKFLKTMQQVNVGWYNTMAAGLGVVQMTTGMNLQFDILGTFGDTWVIYDSPDFGGFFITGTVVVADAGRNKTFTGLVEKLMTIATEQGGVDITIEEETYRDQTLRWLSFGEVPMLPLSWAEIDGRVVMALYPQMVRPAIDQILDQKTSILDNADFARGMKLLPSGSQAITYVDSKSGMQSLYSIGMPLTQFAIAALRTEQGIDIEPTVVPSLLTINRHMFGNVGAITTTEDGILATSHGALPLSIPVMNQGALIVPVAVSILLPSLARARTLAKRSVSMSNLSLIGQTCYIYANEHEGDFPPDLKILVEEYDLGPNTLIAPNEGVSQSEEGETLYSSYIYVTGLTTDADLDLVIAYEREQVNDGEGVNVLFADAHVDWLTMDAFEEALAKTEAYLKATDKEDSK